MWVGSNYTETPAEHADIGIRQDTAPMNRRIADRRYNDYLAAGDRLHRPTTIAPPGLLKPHGHELEAELAQHTGSLVKELRPHTGEPFFCRPGFILYHGDCLSGLEKIGRETSPVALTVTSPPYNIGKDYEEKTPCHRFVDWCTRWLDRVYRVTKENGALWLNLGYFEVPGRGLCVPIAYLLWDRSAFYLLQEVVWHYSAGVSTRKRLSPRNEKWLFYVKNPKAYTFNLDDIRDPNVKYPNQKKNGRYRCHPLGKNPSDVWHYPKVTTGKKRSSRERTDHPAQFPLGVVERIVRASSNPGDIVLDPFAGSCSTGIAACGLGRIFVGLEIRRDYCEMSVRRFKAFEEERRQLAGRQPEAAAHSG